MASGAQGEQEVVSLQNQKGLVVSSSDGMRNPVTLWANSSTHRLLVDIGTDLGTVNQGNPNTIANAWPFELTDGTNTTNILKSDGTAAGNNAVLTGGAYQQITSLSAGSLNAFLLPSTDVGNYQSFSIRITGAWSGQLTFQGSNDNTNWSNTDTILWGDGTNISTTSGSSEGRYGGLPFRYFRIQMTSYSSGTANAVVELYTYTLPLLVQGIAISNTPNVQISDNTNTANILKSDGTAAGQNAQIVAGGGMTTATLTLNAGSPNTAWFDMLNYAWVSVEILTNTTPATLTFQTSGDSSETNVSNMTLQSSGSGSTAVNTNASSAVFHGARAGRYFRISSNNGAGSTTLAITFHTFPSSFVINTVNAIQSGNWSTTSNILGDSGTITTSSSSIVASNVGQYENGFIPITIHGTYTGVSFTITVSDDGGTTYYNVPIYDMNNSYWRAPGSTITPGSNVSDVYFVPVIPNNLYVRILASAYSSGTANIRIGGSQLSSTLPGSFMSQIMDAAGNNRGANVDATNNLNTHGIAESATGLAVPANAVMVGATDGTNLRALTVGFGDSSTSGSLLMVEGFLYNGSTYDRPRSASAGQGTTGTGVLGAAALGWDGTNYQRLQVDSNKNLQVAINGGLNPSNTALNTFSLHSTSNATTTPTASTAYISSIAISNEVGGTTSTITIQDKQGTPLKLVNGLATTALTTAPTIINFQTPVKMVGGIDIITAGAVAATVDVWINYYQ